MEFKLKRKAENTIDTDRCLKKQKSSLLILKKEFLDFLNSDLKLHVEWKKKEIERFKNILNENIDTNDFGKIIRDSLEVIDEPHYNNFVTAFNSLQSLKKSSNEFMTHGCVFEVIPSFETLVRQSNASAIKDFFLPVHCKLLSLKTDADIENTLGIKDIDQIFELYSFEKDTPHIKLNSYLFEKNKELFMSWEEYSSTRGITLHIENLNKFSVNVL